MLHYTLPALAFGRNTSLPRQLQHRGASHKALGPWGWQGLI